MEDNKNEENEKFREEEKQETIKEEWKTEIDKVSRLHTIIKILVILLCLSILGGAGYITYQNFLNNKEENKNDIDNKNDNDNKEDLFTITPSGTANKIYIACGKESTLCYVSDTSNPVEAEVKATYNCTNKSCKGFDVESKYAVIYDDNYYLYDYTTNKATKINLDSLKFELSKIIADEKTIYGVVVIANHDNGIRKSAFYSLEKGKYTIDFNSNYNDIYTVGYGYSEKYSPVLAKGYIFANTLKIVNNLFYYDNYIIEMNSGKVIFTAKDSHTINAIKKDKTIYYLVQNYSTGNVRFKFYNSNLEPLFDSVDYTRYQIKDNGNVILANNKSFSEYNPSGVLIKNSREFKSIQQIIEDYIVVIDNDNYLKIVNFDGDIVAKFVEMTSNLYLHTAISNYFEPENEPHGIYLMVEDKNKSVSNGELRGNKYYYDIRNKTSGVFENVSLGGYDE